MDGAFIITSSEKDEVHLGQFHMLLPWLKHTNYFNFTSFVRKMSGNGACTAVFFPGHGVNTDSDKDGEMRKGNDRD